MRKGLLIYNPFSGSRFVPKMLDELLGHGLSLDLALVPFRLDRRAENQVFLIELLRAPWVEFIVVAGGDGTLGTVARLILSYRPLLPMGIIPAGTCNDFAESLKLPQDERECLDVVALNQPTPLDVGKINGDQVFLSTCAAGLFVNISFSTNGLLKKNLGPLAYYFSALGELGRIRSFPLRIETEREVVEDRFMLFLLINGSQAAGFANLLSQARMGDGLMDLLLVRDVPPLDLPYLLVELFNRDSNGRCIRHIRAKSFKFSSDQAVQTTQDGEEGLPLPFAVEVLPRALHVFVRQRPDQPDALAAALPNLLAGLPAADEPEGEPD
ncbi:MAG: YegS/Rv2252/BmrU family lipid kinase [Peptococcaceae bacterium]|nr:YegS/Rv2252/BmrU family lipid kinase [Peptococcaceae bacterium]